MSLQASEFAGVTELAIEAAVTIEATEASGGKGPPQCTIASAYNGGPLKVNNFAFPVVVDLAGLKLARRMVANQHHDPTRLVGHVTETINDGKTLSLAGLVSGASGAATEVLEASKNGFPWQASIETNEMRCELLAAGKTARVNGQTFSGPVIIARQATLKGVAFVLHGADQNTNVNIAATAASTTEGHTMTFAEWVASLGFDEATLTAAQRSGLEANFNGQVSPPRQPAAPPAQQNTSPAGELNAGGANTNTLAGANGSAGSRSLDEIIDAQRRENAREQELVELCASEIKLNPDKVAQIEAMTRRAIAAGQTASELKASLWDLLPAARRVVNSGSQDGRVGDEVLEAALCLAGGLSDIDNEKTGFAPEVLDAAEKRFGRGIGIQELLALAAGGGHQSFRTHAGLKSTLRAAFAEREELHAHQFSSINLPGILQSAANRFFKEGFMAADQSWRPVSAVRSVRNFYQVKSYSLTGGLDYKVVGPGGEIESGNLGEEEYTNQADTYALLLNIPRKDIINDDIGAITTAPKRLGRGGATKLAKVVWTEFLADHSTFFTTARGNYFTGATSNLSSASLKTALEKFDSQTDPDGEPWGYQPKVLVVCPTDRITALELMSAAAINTGGAASTEKVPNRNIWQSMFQVVVSPYLSNASYGNSTVAWYLLCDPSEAAMLEVCFLNGQEAPTIEQADADFDRLGIRLRGYHDFGANKQEYRAAVKSKGAA